MCRAAGCFTCALPRPGADGGAGGGGSGTASYVVGGLSEVQGVVEDLNGVSMRQRQGLAT